MPISKVTTIPEAIGKHVRDGDTIAIGGMHGHNNPMSLVRELVRQCKRIGCLVVSPSASLNADLPIGAGLVDEVLAPYIGFEHFGLAPCFRRAVEEGALKVRECETSLIINGLRAGAAGVAFHPVTTGVEDTSIPELNPDDYKWVTDPFTGEKVLCTPAINPDVALIHCLVSDYKGTALFGSAVFSDWDMVRASKKVILMVEKVMDEMAVMPEQLLDAAHSLSIAQGMRRSNHRVVPHLFVDAVVEASLGCHPTSSHRAYEYDNAHIERYLKMARTEDGFKEYIKKYVTGTKDHDGYLKLVISEGGKARSEEGQRRPKAEDGPPTRTEIMISMLSNELHDGEVVIMGANSSIPLMACMLASTTHAKDLTYLTGGSGGVNPRPWNIPLSSCHEDLLKGPSTIELGDLIDAQALKGVDVFFAGGLQVDRRGNLNLIGVGPHGRPKLRGPGTAGLSLFNMARRIIIYMTNHSPQQFVSKVDHISGTGRPVNNMVKVVSPFGVMDFDNKHRMRLVSLHLGVTLEQIRDATGFEMIGAEEGADIPTTPSPSEEEISIMRGIDPVGNIRNRMK